VTFCRSEADVEAWRPLREELDRWEDAGRIANLWLRDDDAVEVTPALEMLARLCSEYGVPCLIASIPARASAELAGYIGDQPLLSPAQHGFAHRNHAIAGMKAQEFPVTRPHVDSLDELGAGRARLSSLFGAKLLPMYVPPWNRIAPEVAALLPGLGLRALSTFGRNPLFPQSPPLVELNTHVDIIDWRGSRGGRDAAWLANDLANELKWSREEESARAIGVLTHHLVHDEAAWRFLAGLFAVTADCRSVRWRRAVDLIGAE
jgi:hypothetical protein